MEGDQLDAFPDCVTAAHQRPVVLGAHLPTGPELRDQGMRRVLSTKEGLSLKAKIMVTIGALAERGYLFTSDDVMAALDEATLELLSMRKNALGSLMRAAAMRGTIEDTGTTWKTVRADGHARRIIVWRGKKR